MIVDVEKGGLKLRVCNIYNSGHEVQGWVMDRWPVGLAQEGDFNVHHEVWDAGCRAADARGIALLDTMDRERLCLLNQPGVCTWRRGSSESTLDLAWCNVDTHQMDVRWAVYENEDIGSDHEAIAVDILGQAEWVSSPIQESYITKEATEKEWEECVRAVEVVVREREGEWNQACEACDGSKLADLLGAALMAGMMAFRRKKMHWRSKGWWDKELGILRGTATRARRVWKQSVLQQDRDDALGYYKVCRNTYFRAIRTKKKKMWEDFVGERGREDLWQILRVVKGVRTTRLPELVTVQGSAVSFEEKE
ncbi:unnamed protein product [Tuber aestivum]|uniref:Endonuclease/exonuclease/phosphatase domain-containing protein n=1 Tax=Tuber aestivum TaxID=59557 RepID=A0A292Q5K6_9PEZI|nr:unnamed protein product [Tuber aestivum]